MKTLYGTKQASLQYWRKSNEAFQAMNYERSKADACLHFTWTETGHLNIWVKWVDDNFCVGIKEQVFTAKRNLMKFKKT